MPVIVVVLGEGGSGGALAIGIGDRVLMMENAVYSVITPEGCAAILWKDAEEASRAATALKLTANDLAKFSLIDEVIPEPEKWALSTDNGTKSTAAFEKISQTLKRSLSKHIKELTVLGSDELLEERYKKFRKMGEWI